MAPQNPKRSTVIANKSSRFYFSSKSRAAKRLRFDPKEKQCLKEMENGACGHLNMFVH
jgi:hypothetical protein